MRKSAQVFCWMAAWLVWITAGHAADFTRIGPQATAAELIAAHGTAAGPVLRVVYQSAAPDQATMTAEIARDYVFVRRTEAGEPDTVALHDFALRRVIAIDDAHRAFANMSMYAMADFRFAESYNRRVLRGILRSAGIKALVNPYFDQQQLGIASPDDGPVEFKREPTAGGGLRFVVDGKTGAAYEPSAENLSADEMQGVMRLLRSSFQLHPEMLAAIAAGLKLPKEIVHTEGMADKRSERHWTLVSVERTQGAYPLPAGYGVTVSGGEQLAPLMPVMLDAIAGKSGGGPRSLADYRAAISDAKAKGNVLQHYLLDNEMYLQYRSGTMGCFNGNLLHEDCSQQQAVVDWWKADAVTLKLMQSLLLEKTNPEEAIAERNAIARTGLTDAYMLDLWNADTMMQSGKGGDPLPLFALAIKGNPYVGGFYKDLGDAYRIRFYPVQAWLCYDLARALPGAQSSPVVDGIDRMEATIASRNPEFF